MYACRSVLPAAVTGRRLMKRSSAFALAFLLVPLTACSGEGDGGGVLHWVGDESVGGNGGEFGIGQADVKPGTTYAFGSIELCVKGAPSATVDRVSFRSDDHLKVVRFAVRRLDYATQAGLGNERGSLLSSGFQAGSSIVDTPCVPSRDDGPGPPVSELGLDVTSDSAVVAIGKTLIVFYRTGQSRSTAEVPLTLKLCPGSGQCS